MKTTPKRSSGRAVKRATRMLAAASTALALFSPALAHADGFGASASGPDAGWLHADGTLLRDVNGAVVDLHGGQMVNGGASQGIVNALQQAHFNSVRQTVVWSQLEPNKPTLNPDGSLTHHWNENYLNALDNQITRLQQAHIRVILDDQQSSWSRAFDPNAYGLPGWLYPTTHGGKDEMGQARADFFHDRPDPGLNLGNWKPQELYIEGLKELVDHFKNDSYVVGIDIMNEPPSPPGLSTPVDGQEILDFFDKSVDAMSPINPHLLWVYENGTMANSLQGGSPLSGNMKLDRPNAVLSWHYYPDMDLLRPSETVAQGVARMFGLLQDQVQLAQRWNQPFYLGEFDAYREGFNNRAQQVFHNTSPNWSTLTGQLMAYTRANHVSWNFWAFNNGAGASLVDGRDNLKADIVSVLRQGIDTSGDPGPGRDTTPPSTVTGLQVSPARGNGVVLSWNPANDNVGVVGYRVFQNGTQIGTQTDTSVRIPSVPCGSPVVFGVVALDAAGNASAPANLPYTQDCPPSGDTTPPSAVANLRAERPSSSGLTLRWSQATDNVGVAGYRVYEDGAVIGTQPGTSLHVDGLTCGTAATFAVEALDAAGNVGPQSTLSYTPTCSGGGDDTAPSTPGNLHVVDQTASSVDLAWSASSDDTGVTAYRVTSGRRAQTTVTGTTASLSGLRCGKQLTFSVVALDAAGNASQPATVAATLTCQNPGGGSDGAGPDVKLDSYKVVKHGKHSVFTAQVSLGDDHGLARVFLVIDGKFSKVRNFGHGTRHASVALTSRPLRSGKHTFAVRAGDWAGNHAVSRSVSVRLGS